MRGLEIPATAHDQEISSVGLCEEQRALGQAPVQIGIVRPAPELAGLIDSFYVVRTSQTVSDHYLASPGNIRLGWGGWILTVDGEWVPTPHKTALFGPADRSAVFGSKGPGVMLGAGLTPLGWVQLLDVPAREMANKVDKLSRFVGQEEGDRLFDLVRPARMTVPRSARGSMPG